MKYLKMLRDEVTSPSISRIEPGEISDYHNAISQQVADARRAGGFAREYMLKYLEKIYGDSLNLARARALKSVLGFEFDDRCFDRSLLEGVRQAISEVARYLSGLVLVLPDGRVVTRIISDTVYKGARLRRGDIVCMNIDDAIRLTLASSALLVGNALWSLLPGRRDRNIGL